MFLPGTPLGSAASIIDDKKSTQPVDAVSAILEQLPKAQPPTAFEMTRMIATCRIVLPRTMVRLSAGRLSFSPAEQALMFLAAPHDAKP